MGAGLGHQHPHKGIVEGVKHTRDHQDQADKGGRQAQHILIIVHDIGGRQRVDHILAHCADAEGGFLLCCQFHTAHSFFVTVNSTVTGAHCGAETVSAAVPICPTVRR